MPTSGAGAVDVEPWDVSPASVGRYDPLARLLHWIFAVGIIYASIVGWALGFIANHPVHDFLSALNSSLATVLIPLFPLRVVWKFVRRNPPEPPIDARQLRVARGVQALLYLTIFEVLVTGFLMTPHSYPVFGLYEQVTPFEKGPVTEAFGQAHLVGNAVLGALVLLHVAGVLRHTLAARVNILSRML